MATSETYRGFASPRVPPELCDYVIDFLHNDRHSLAACSLTCKAWLPAVRYHMFSSIILQKHRFDTFSHLLYSSPHIGSYVKDLTIEKLSYSQPKSDGDMARYYPFDVMEQLFPSIFSHLPAVTSLSVTLVEMNAIAAIPMAPTVRDSLMKNLQSVEDLTINYCRFNAFEDLVDILHSFPRLRCLALHGITWRDRFGRKTQSLLVPPSLNKLTLGRDMDVASIIDWLMTESLHLNVRSLYASSSTESDANAIGKLVVSLGSCLQDLELDWYPSRLKEVCLPATLTVESCIELRTLTIHCPVMQRQSLPWVTELLSQVTSSSMEMITFKVRLLGTLDAFGWEQMERTLSEKRFRGLRALRFKVVVWPSVMLSLDEVERSIRGRLPALDSKHILRFPFN